jgi:hypothetical protein
VAEIELLRCTTPYWFTKGGVETLMAAGTVLPKGHPDVIDIYFEPLEIDAVTTAQTRTARRKG